MVQTAQINHLSVAFQSELQTLHAIDDVNFQLKPGETLALLGESGCGKSLTALALMRLLPTNSVYGLQSSIAVSGVDLLNLPESFMRAFRGRQLAMIFQEPMTALNPVMTIETQVKEAITQHQSIKRQALKKRVVSLLQEVELPEVERRLKQYPHQLSGGQKQRVVIAIALACQPDILIADEPTTALDVTVQAQILTLLKKLQKRHQMSLLLITHDLSVVKANADTIAVMYAGQIVETATVADFFTSPLHPYAQQLLQAVPSLKYRGQHLQTIKGLVPALDAMPQGCRFHPRCAHKFAPCATIAPQIQEFAPARFVRCHLYPEHTHPPNLSNITELWEKIAQNQNDVIVRVDDLQVYYRGKARPFGAQDVFKAVDGVSFSLKRGETLALVGESGCGKTTLARALLGIQPITCGQVYYRGLSLKTLGGRTLRQFRQKVQIIFQDPFSSMNPRMTIGEIIAEGIQLLGLSAQEVHQKQLQLLDQVNLAKSSLIRYPHQFSGGQRQRICIARALATEPELLICDEPTSALDVSVQGQILNLLKRLQQDFGLSYLFITHDMSVVSYMADEILVMKAGKIVESGGCEAVFANPAHAYTKKLLASVLVV